MGTNCRQPGGSCARPRRKLRHPANNGALSAPILEAPRSPPKYADLATVPAVPVSREPPPRGMPEDEAALWTRTLADLPPHWLPAAAYPLLEIYVAAVINMRACRAVALAEVEGSPRHHAASRLYRAEAAVVLRLAKTLRLGPRFDRTAVRAVPTGPRPWDIGQSAPAANPFGWTPPDDGAA